MKSLLRLLKIEKRSQFLRRAAKQVCDIFTNNVPLTSLDKAMPKFIVRQKETQINFSNRVKSVVDEMFKIFAHSNLSHQLVLVPIHARQLTDMGKHVLYPVCQLKYNQ